MRSDHIDFLNNFCTEDDCVDGAAFVGDAAGDSGTDWRVYNMEMLDSFIKQLNRDAARPSNQP